MQTTQRVEQLKTAIEWGQFLKASQQHLYLKSLFDWFELADMTDSSVDLFLSQVRSRKPFDQTLMPTFKGQSELKNDSRYYEQIIAETDQIPTRIVMA